MSEDRDAHDAAADAVEFVPDNKIRLLDPHNLTPAYADWFIDIGARDGVFQFGLGAVDHTLMQGDDQTVAVVAVAKIRMPLTRLQHFQAILGLALLDAGIPLIDPETMKPPVSGGDQESLEEEQ